MAVDTSIVLRSKEKVLALVPLEMVVIGVGHGESCWHKESGLKRTLTVKEAVKVSFPAALPAMQTYIPLS